MSNPLELPPKMPTVQPLLFEESELPIPDGAVKKIAETTPEMRETPEVSTIDPLTLSHTEILPLLKGLNHEQLVGSYKKWIGKDPIARGLSDEEIRTGVQDPVAEIERLTSIDRAQDEDDRNAPHYTGRR